MRINLVGATKSYCGTVKSFEHNRDIGFTVVTFTGGINKMFKDFKMNGVLAIENAFVDNKNYLTLKTKDI